MELCCVFFSLGSSALNNQGFIWLTQVVPAAVSRLVLVRASSALKNQGFIRLTQVVLPAVSRSGSGSGKRASNGAVRYFLSPVSADVLGQDLARPLRHVQSQITAFSWQITPSKTPWGPAQHPSTSISTLYANACIISTNSVHQGQVTSVLQSLAPSLNPPHRPVALVILTTLISWFRCVWLGLELNSAGQRPSSRSRYNWFSARCAMPRDVSEKCPNIRVRLISSWMIIQSWVTTVY